MIFHILPLTLLANFMSFHFSSCCNCRDEYSKPLKLYPQRNLWFGFCYTLYLWVVLTHISNFNSGVPFLYETFPNLPRRTNCDYGMCFLCYIYLIKSVLPIRRLWTPWQQQNKNHVFSCWPSQCSVQVPGMQLTLSNCFLEMNWTPMRSRLARLYHRNSAKLHCGKVS